MKARNYTVHAPFVRPVTEHDKLREARIENLSALSLQALKSGNTNEFRRLEKELKAAALARSPEAIHHLAKARVVAEEAAD